MIQQRLHEDDVTGHILDSEANDEWEKLILPAEYEGERFVSSLGEKFNDPRNEMGEILWPKRFGKEQLDYEKKIKGEKYFAGQYQQRPSPIAGNTFKREWFENWILNTDVVERFISWDTAASIGNGSAYSACTVGELTSDYRLFIREIWRDRLEFPQLQKAIEDMAKKYKHKLNRIIIENKSSGTSVLQALQQSSGDEIADLLFGFNPVGKKEERGSIISIWCENGSIILPPPNEMNPWLFEFEEELFNFPNCKYKDQVDSFNQLVFYLRRYLAEGHKYRKENNVK